MTQLLCNVTAHLAQGRQVAFRDTQQINQRCVESIVVVIL